MIVAGLVLIGAAAGVTFFLIVQGETRTDFSLDTGSVSMSLKDIHLVHGQEGKKLWELSAQAGVFHQDTGSVDLEKPSFVFILEDRPENVQVKASNGTINRDRQAVHLWPDVEVHYAGSVLQAESMHYQQSKQDLVFSGNVRMDDPRMDVSSRKARLNLQNRTLFLSEQVRVVLQ
jgi:LPS export ABC transporter protein LptC